MHNNLVDMLFNKGSYRLYKPYKPYKQNQILPDIREDTEEVYHVDVYTKIRHYGGYGDNFIDETTHYKNDMKHGQYTRRNEDKMIVYKCMYKDGIKHGPEIYYDNFWGTTRQTCTYEEGKLDGEFCTYNEMGELNYKCYYVKGVKKNHLTNALLNVYRFMFF